MPKCAKDGTDLNALVKQTIPFCRQAERLCPRTGPGRKPTIPDWVMAVLIVIAVMKKRKSKSAQFRFIKSKHQEFKAALGTDCLPERSTYFERYRRAWKLYEVAVRLAGQYAIRKKYTSARCVAVDKSVVPALGPPWYKRHALRGKYPRGADLEATWTYSAHDGWVQGYGYEIVVSAEKTGAVWPLLASADAASRQPNRTFPAKIPCLPETTRYVVADSGYDSNALAEAIEIGPNRKRTGKRLLCPHTNGMQRPAKKVWKMTKERREHRRLREARKEFMTRPFAKRMLRRRGCKVEPFNDWLKARFELHHRVWHRGLDNNRTQLLASIFAYQILLLVNHRCGRRNGCVQWILDGL